MRKKISITIDATLIEKLDQLYGRFGRAYYIESLLRENLVDLPTLEKSGKESNYSEPKKKTAIKKSEKVKVTRNPEEIIKTETPSSPKVIEAETNKEEQIKQPQSVSLDENRITQAQTLASFIDEF